MVFTSAWMILCQPRRCGRRLEAKPRLQVEGKSALGVVESCETERTHREKTEEVLLMRRDVSKKRPAGLTNKISWVLLRRHTRNSDRFHSSLTFIVRSLGYWSLTWLYPGEPRVWMQQEILRKCLHVWRRAGIITSWRFGRAWMSTVGAFLLQPSVLNHPHCCGHARVRGTPSNMSTIGEKSF